jgi:putative Holliday junction resolvase
MPDTPKTTSSLITQSTADLRAALPMGGVLMGLDPGTKTIGVALCDAGWRFATAGKTIIRRKFAQDKAQIAQIIAERAVKALVIGLPLNMDGSPSPRSQSARAMARNLADLGLPILMWDERWSTQAAERAMIEQDFSRAKRAERIDSHAAALILQAAIDSLAGGIL